uniref:Uncharacterized protein n=1 Tax=Rhizophora mucronata TaxID=61149 RepID=A0A2P2P588_RHIMU
MMTKMLTSSLRFLIDAKPFKRTGTMPTPTAARANHFNGGYTYLRNASSSRTPLATA